MKKKVITSLKYDLNAACREKGVEPTKRMLRGVKKFYLKQTGQVRKQMRG